MTRESTGFMRDRFAGQALIEKTLVEQARVRPRGSLAQALGIDPLSDDVRPWYTGARGELEVGRILDALPDEWTTFHSLPIGSGETDIDHVVVGPAGVFTLNTKSHRGKNIWVAGRTFMVAGHKKPGYIVAAEREASRVTDLIRSRVEGCPPARPLLVIVGPSKITLRTRPEHVTVLDAVALRRWLRRQRQVLTPDQRQMVTGVLNDPALWPSRSPNESEDAMGAFSKLEREVRSASIVRAAWSIAGVGAAVWAASSILPAILRSLLP